jgi:glycosyltransferase involved in cell wall biosynthesis
VPPKVSVCIPTYNYAEYISAAIESVLKQDFKDYELIIQDDCSSDKTREVVQKYLSDERITFEVNKINLGLPGNWNHCLSKAKGEYIKFVFADDILTEPGALGRMVSILDSNPNVSIVASARNFIDSQSHLLQIAAEFKKDFTADGKDIIYHCLCKENNLIGEPTVVMFRKLDGVRGFDPRYGQAVDLEMWFYLLEKGSFAFIHEPLASFRIHPRQKTVENAESLIHIDEFCLLLDEYMPKYYMSVNPIIKYYWKYNTIYQFWKAKKKGLISSKDAYKRIGASFSLPQFLLLYPVYKIVRPIIKVLRRTGLICSFNYPA